ncbi:uncharacterized protein LOC120427972 [Culex pipiens pallens]|uniref:uncharacterized protein LOC120427972 n=1 Tax=Culex pipiens pallens TaxID=42434 RepID=UPI001952E422|nr:uncharacterized protein LOC120427972 [Culex pipiens pallens]
MLGIRLNRGYRLARQTDDLALTWGKLRNTNTSSMSSAGTRRDGPLRIWTSTARNCSVSSANTFTDPTAGGDSVDLFQADGLLVEATPLKSILEVKIGGQPPGRASSLRDAGNQPDRRPEHAAPVSAPLSGWPRSEKDLYNHYQKT